MKYKRLKIAAFTGAILTFLAVAAMFKGMETLAITATGGIISTAGLFIAGDSYRKSDN